MESITSFDQLPNAVNLIFERLASIETLLTQKEDQPQTPPDELLTIEQAAEFLSLSVPTIYTKVSQKKIPYMKPAKRLYFSRAELMDYLSKGRKKSTAEIEAEADAYLSNSKKK